MRYQAVIWFGNIPRRDMEVHDTYDEARARAYELLKKEVSTHTYSVEVVK